MGANESKVTQSVKTVKRAVSRQSSEDLTDSDFEPKKSQRVKLSTIKEEKKPNESRKESPLTIHSLDSGKEKKRKGKSEPLCSESSKVQLLLEDLLEDMNCVSGVLADQVAYHKEKYFTGKACTQDQMIAACQSMMRKLQSSIESLNKVDKGLTALDHELHSSNANSNGFRESEAILIVESDEVDSQLDTSLPTCSPNLLQTFQNGKNDITAKRCGSISSEGADELDSPKPSNSSEEATSSKEQVDSEMNPENVGGPCNETELDPNESCDLFSDFDGRADDCSTNEYEEHGHNGNEESTRPRSAIQSKKSISMKAGLMVVSSSDSDSDQQLTRKGSSSNASKNKNDIQRWENSSESDSEALPLHTNQSQHDKAKFDIKNLDVFHSDIKLQGIWSVNIAKMDESEVKRYLDVVGNYYDAKSTDEADSDNSVDK